MRFLSLFSGIGGFDLGLERAGWECVGQVEIDRFCTKVLARHWPDVPRWTDITRICGGELPVADLICGGFPCQDLSVAGKRAGLAGDRSGLFWEFVRIIKEMRVATHGRSPTFALLENVAGLLSSNGGRDFAAVLAGLADAGALDIGWRILDSRWFGVPQRRRRVFLVADFGGERTAEVLFEPPGVLGDLAESDGAGEDAPAGIAGELGDDGGGVTFTPWDTQSRRVYAATGPVPTLQNRAHRGHESLRVLTTKLHNTKSNQSGKFYEDYAPSLQEHSPAPAALYYSHDYNQDRIYDPEGIAPAVCAQDSSGARQELTGAAVRRLTPTECERLQAFRDGWTCLCGVESYSTQDCRCPDGPRYAALGNAVTTSVIEWLGRRMLAAHTEESA